MISIGYLSRVRLLILSILNRLIRLLFLKTSSFERIFLISTALLVQIGSIFMKELVLNFGQCNFKKTAKTLGIANTSLLSNIYELF